MKALKINLRLTERGIHIPDNYREAYENMVDFCKEKRGGYIFLTLAPPRKPRSTGPGSQSAHFHGHCQQIAEFTGESFDVVKMHIKREAIKRGYPTRETRFGDVIPQSEADASTEECAMLIESAHEVAAFLDLELYEGE